jgi:L-rhamnose-H+ transport protein
MPDSLGAGLALVLFGGVFQGSFMYPSKHIKGWAWENYWLIFAATAYVACPWIIAALTVPRLAEVYSGLPPRPILSALLFGLGWGLGAVLFGLGVDALGIALGFAVILGITATAGTVLPLLIQRPENFSAAQGILTAIALALMLSGVVICSFAGRWKERAGASGLNVPYARGLALCIGSGLLCACGNLGFAFGTEVSHRARALGAPEQLAANALWVLLEFPMFVCNAGFAAWLLRRNGSTALFRRPGSLRMGVLAVLMGAMWTAGMSLYGSGARALGPLGSSLGWAILMSSMVLVANALGLLSGEWSEAPASARRRLGVGIAVLLAAIAVLGFANGSS